MSGPVRPVSARRREVLTLIAEGWSNKEIAARMGISSAGVKKHIEGLMLRYRVSRRTALVRAAIGARDLGSS